MSDQISKKNPKDQLDSLPYTNSLTLRLEIDNNPGMIDKVLSAIGGGGGNVGAIDLIEFNDDKLIRDITFSVWDEQVGKNILKALRKLPGVKLIRYYDPVFSSHLGGKIEIRSKISLNTRRDLSIAYTPGVARVSSHIHETPNSVWDFTGKRNTVAIVTDGTAVLGLGDIGPAAAMPVMEGKALLFKEFANVDAWPLCLDTQDPKEIIDTVKNISIGFGGINLEDISAPRCFEIEAALKEQLDIPVFHDDQHGTAVAVIAALLNAAKLVKKNLDEFNVVVSGVGASGVATVKMLLSYGVKNIIGCDRSGAVYRGRVENMNFMKNWFAENTNISCKKGSLNEIIEGADLFIGLSAPGVLKVEHIKKMNKDPIIFAMANPDPEILPDQAAPHVAIMATGRSDFANQINNVLVFPGIFRGSLDVQAITINEEMKKAAAEAIAGTISTRQLQADYIIPSVLNKNVSSVVATAVSTAARKSGVDRKSKYS